ncbi:MAG: DinB family protein [Candidatus Acidiferrales bacterium]
MTPEQAKFLADILLPSVQKEYGTTRRVLQAVPPGKQNYRPHPDSRSALELVWHIASSDVWFLDGFLTGKFEMEDDSMPGDIGSSEDIVALYEDGFESKMPKLARLSPEFWALPVPFFGIYNDPMVLYLQFMLHHTIHHRGQLSAYLRQMGGKVPNIYGGSFDEPFEVPPEK